MYPRLTDTGKPISDEQMVGSGEHLVNKHRILSLDGVFTGSMTASNYLLALDSRDKSPIKILITSPGGDLDSAFLLYDTMRLISSPVYTIGRYCASAAALILAAGSKRYLMPHAKVMLHLPSGQLMGDTGDIDIQHEQITMYKNKVIELLLECGVKKTAPEILKDIDRNFWLEPAEAIEYGLADEILGEKTLGEWLA
uniref:Putative protease n=1 Tax=viral metagenome TaxID=1070528 RepID=A0A6H1ZR84_9ZZZZ